VCTEVACCRHYKAYWMLRWLSKKRHYCGNADCYSLRRRPEDGPKEMLRACCLSPTLSGRRFSRSSSDTGMRRPNSWIRMQLLGIVTLNKKLSFWRINLKSAEFCNIVTCIPSARQRLGKHILARSNARDNRTYIARQRRGKHASSTIQTVFCVVRAEGLRKDT
jgi:hypothetical protein